MSPRVASCHCGECPRCRARMYQRRRHPTYQMRVEALAAATAALDAMLEDLGIAEQHPERIRARRALMLNERATA
jgi:hypothetical protein